MLQGVPVLWSTHWCPARHPQEGLLPPRWIRPGALGHSGKPLRWLQAEGEQGLGISLPGGVTSLPVGGGGGRSCSHAQGIADRQRRWGQEGIFPRGRLALVPGGFLPSSAALSTTTCCQGSSAPFWLGHCLLLMHHEDGLSCPAAGGRKAFFPPRWASRCPRGFFAFLCGFEHRPLARPALGHFGQVPAAHAPRRWPSCPASGGRKLARPPGRAPREAPGACFLSSVALSTTPWRGSSGPFRLGSCLLLLHRQGATLSGPGALGLSCPVQLRSGSELCSSLGSLSPGVLASAKQPGFLEGLQPCCTTSSSCHFAALPAGNPSAGQAQAHFSRVAGREAQRSKFWNAKLCFCHRWAPYFAKYPTVPHTSTSSTSSSSSSSCPSFVCGQS